MCHKFIYTTLFLVFTQLIMNAQAGIVHDHVSLNSDILDGERHYAVYLPPDYNTSQRSYPVLYLLHGAGDDHTGWVQFGEVQRIADESIRNGSATPMVIIMPDAMTGKKGYWDRPNGEWNYEQFFFDELMPFVENKYRIKKEKRFRAISGLSMGGGGAFVYAMHRPDLFSASCPMSAYVGPLSSSEMKVTIKDRFKDQISYSNQQIDNYYKRYDAHYMANFLPVDDLNSVRWYIDCGDDDFLYEGNSLIHLALKNREVIHEYRVRNGAHNWTYWRESLVDVLKFVSDGFHQY